MSFGVTSTGFVAKTLTDIQSDLETAFKSAFGQGIDVSPQSVYGQIIGIMAERIADMWDAMSATYAAWTPEGATAQSLDNLCALTGTIRNPATYSSVTVTLSGTNGTVVPAGSIVAVGPNGNRFSLVSQVTIGGSPTPGVFQAVSPGPVIALAGTLTYIATPVAGWSGATNALDATLGANVETDALLRLKREAELHVSGSGTVDAIRAKVLALAGVTGCQVFDNPGDVTDGNGVPPHSFETLVAGSPDVPTLLQTIWVNKPLGIRAYGAIPGTVTDSQGFTQNVAYSTPTELDVYVILNITVDSTIWNTGNVAAKNAALVAALLAYGTTIFVNGKDVVAGALESVAFAQVGMLDASALIGLAPSPSTRTTIPVSIRQFGKLDSGRITINVTYGTP